VTGGVPMTERPFPEESGRVKPKPIEMGMSVSALMDTTFLGSTAGMVAKGARLLTEQVYRHPGSVVGLSVDATLTPGGAAVAALAPLLRGGYVDWLAVTGINLYYDALHSLDQPLLRSVPPDDPDVAECGGGGIYIRTRDREAAEATLREIFSGPDFQQPMGSAKVHDLLGRQLRVREKAAGVEFPGLLSTAHELGVPLYNASPADSPLGSLIADLARVGNRLLPDTNADLNHAAAILNATCKDGEPIVAWCVGRGSASNFVLGTPQHLQRILGPSVRATYALRLRMAECGHALPVAPCESSREAGSGSPPLRTESAETREGIADLMLSTDLSIAVPLLVAYLMDRTSPRPPKRLGHRRDEFLDRLRQDHLQATLKKPL